VRWVNQALLNAICRARHRLPLRAWLATPTAIIGRATAWRLAMAILGSAMHRHSRTGRTKVDTVIFDKNRAL